MFLVVEYNIGDTTDSIASLVGMLTSATIGIDTLSLMDASAARVLVVYHLFADCISRLAGPDFISVNTANDRNAC